MGMQTDWIKLTGVTAWGTHGVLTTEHLTPQPFVVDVEYEVVTELAYKSDDIAYTVSYAQVAQIVVDNITGAHCDLLETLAQHIAQDVLHLGVREVVVRVHKPQAPIEHTFQDVSVQVRRSALIKKANGLFEYVLGLGANLGESNKTIRLAVKALEEYKVEVLRASSLYQSVPILRLEQEAQPDYCNAVVLVRTSYAPLEFLEQVAQEIEFQFGRTRTESWGARTLDIDILQARKRTMQGQWEEIISSDVELTLPHPQVRARRFVLEPWLEIEPTAVVDGESLSSYLPATLYQDLHKISAENKGVDNR